MTIIAESCYPGEGDPSTRVSSRTIDNGNGTATTTTYAPDGTVTGTTTAPIVPLPAVVVNERTIRDSFTQALTRSTQIKSQMDTIQAATFANNTQRDTAIKTISEAVEDLNTGLRKLIRLIDNRLDSSD